MATKKEAVEDVIAKAVSAAIAASHPPQPEQPPRRPFFSAKSPGMWSVFGGLIVYGITIFGSINGCFQSKFTKDQKLEFSYNTALSDTIRDKQILILQKQVTDILLLHLDTLPKLSTLFYWVDYRRNIKRLDSLIGMKRDKEQIIFRGR